MLTQRLQLRTGAPTGVLATVLVSTLGLGYAMLGLGSTYAAPIAAARRVGQFPLTDVMLGVLSDPFLTLASQFVRSALVFTVVSTVVALGALASPERTRRLTTPLTAVALWSAMSVLASMPDRVPNALSVFGLLSVTAGGEEVHQQVAVLAGLSITLLAALLLVSTHDMVRGHSRNRRTAGPLPGAWIVAISAAASVLLASGAALTVDTGSGSALTVSLFAAVGGLVQFLLYLVVMLTAAYLSAARWIPVVVIVMLATLPPPGVRIPWLPIHAAFDSALTTHSTRAALGNLAVLLAGLIVVTGLSYVITSTHDLRAASSLPRPRRHP